MIITIKKRNLIFLLIFIVVALPLIYAGTATQGFKVELFISNTAPTINLSNNSVTINLVSGDKAVLFISFNVTDQNGAGDINASKAIVNLTLGVNSQWYQNISDDGTREFGTCTNSSPSSTVVTISCNVDVPYYANASSNWVLNVSVKDRSGAVGRTNSSGTITINTLSGLSLTYTSVNFSSVTLGQLNVLAYPHLQINNTGNDDFGQVNLSAAALVGTTTPSESIGVTQFGVNTSNSSTSLRLTFPSTGIVNLWDTLTGQNVSFRHGHTSAFTPNADKGNLSAFLWVNVPSSGLTSQLFNSTWNVTAVTTP